MSTNSGIAQQDKSSVPPGRPAGLRLSLPISLPDQPAGFEPGLLLDTSVLPASRAGITPSAKEKGGRQKAKRRLVVVLVPLPSPFSLLPFSFGERVAGTLVLDHALGAQVVAGLRIEVPAAHVVETELGTTT